MEDDDEKPPHLPMDIILKLPEHISDPATLARAASSYKPWRSTIKDPAFLAGLARRRGDHGFTFTPSLLLGFFYQEREEAPPDLWQHQEDMTRCLAPSLISTSELLPFRGRGGISKDQGFNTVNPMSLGTFLPDIGTDLNFYQPIASQDSFLALSRGRSMYVCNPVSGELFQVPDCPGRTAPQHYVLLVSDYFTGGIHGNTGRVSSSPSFRLVIIWNTGKKLIYRYYCSTDDQWKLPMGIHEVMPGHYLMSSPPPVAAVSNGRGVVHYFCGRWQTMAPAYLFTININNTGQEDPLYVDLPPDAKSSKQAPPLLASSVDGATTLLLLVKGLQMTLWKHRNDSTNGDWIRSEVIDLTSFSLPPRVKRRRAKVRPEIFRGKSGVVVIWMDGEGLY